MYVNKMVELLYSHSRVAQNEQDKKQSTKKGKYETGRTGGDRRARRWKNSVKCKGKK